MKIFICFAFIFSIVSSSSLNFVTLNPNEVKTIESTINTYYVKIFLGNPKTLVYFSLKTITSYEQFKYYLSEKDLTEEEIKKLNYKTVSTIHSELNSQTQDEKFSLTSSKIYLTEADLAVNNNIYYAIFSFDFKSDKESMTFTSKTINSNIFIKIDGNDKKNFTSDIGVYYTEIKLNQSYASLTFIVESPLVFNKMRTLESEGQKSESDIPSLNFNERRTTVTKVNSSVSSNFLSINLDEEGRVVFNNFNSIGRESEISSSINSRSYITFSINNSTRYVYISFNSLIHGEPLKISADAFTKGDMTIILIVVAVVVIIGVIIGIAYMKNKGGEGDYREA